LCQFVVEACHGREGLQTERRAMNRVTTHVWDARLTSRARSSTAHDQEAYACVNCPGAGSSRGASAAIVFCLEWNLAYRALAEIVAKEARTGHVTSLHDRALFLEPLFVERSYQRVGRPVHITDARRSRALCRRARARV